MPGKRIAIAVLLSPIILVVGFGVWFSATYKDDRVTRGAAYGFEIGETAERAYDRATLLHANGAIVEFRLGTGSGAALVDPATPNSATRHDHWRLVVDSDWWNNAINLTFEEGRLVEIWRFRMCCEMP